MLLRFFENNFNKYPKQFIEINYFQLYFLFLGKCLNKYKNIINIFYVKKSDLKKTQINSSSIS